MNGYIENNSGSEYLTLILADEIKGETKKYKKIWNKIHYLTELKINNSKYKKYKHW